MPKRRSIPRRKTEASERPGFRTRWFPDAWVERLPRVPDRQMKTRFAIRPLRLNTSELFAVSDGEGFTIECLEGSVRIAQADDPRNVALIAGQAFVLDRPGLALVCAAAGSRSPGDRKVIAAVGAVFLEMRNAARNLPIRGSVKMTRSNPAQVICS